jgi:hypothetical protein
MTDFLVLALDPEPGRYATEDPRLMPGDHVKLGFRVEPPRGTFQSEWMWVEVTAMAGAWPDVSYRGELCNCPALIDAADLRPGQPIEFGPGHVYCVVHDSPARPEGQRDTPP